MAYEVYIVRIGRRGGKRYGERLPLNVPLDLATGQYEELSDMAVRDFINDLRAEQLRRTETAARRVAVEDQCGGYDPFASQFKGGS